MNMQQKSRDGTEPGTLWLCGMCSKHSVIGRNKNYYIYFEFTFRASNIFQNMDVSFSEQTVKFPFYVFFTNWQDIPFQQPVYKETSQNNDTVREENHKLGTTAQQGQSMNLNAALLLPLCICCSVFF